MNPLEAAAQAMRSDVLESPWPVIRAFLRAVVAHSQCKGSKWVRCDKTCKHPERCEVEVRCPAEHVELEIGGETVWADPDKCEWRHTDAHLNEARGANWNAWSPTCELWECPGFQPRWVEIEKAISSGSQTEGSGDQSAIQKALT